MIIKEGRLYFIKDEFLEKYGKKYNLMDNKIEKGTKRPTYFCFRDEKEHNILWFVPMSKQYDKYNNIYATKKEKIKKEPSNFVFFDNIAGLKGVFLIQNMFPTTKKYIQEEYYRRGQEVRVPKIIQKEIIQKATSTILFAKNGIVTTYTNLPEFIKDIHKEIELDKERNVEKNIEDDFDDIDI